LQQCHVSLDCLTKGIVKTIAAGLTLCISLAFGNQVTVRYLFVCFFGRIIAVVVRYRKKVFVMLS
jgi:hypothetical protein